MRKDSRWSRWAALALLQWSCGTHSIDIGNLGGDAAIDASGSGGAISGTPSGSGATGGSSSTGAGGAGATGVGGTGGGGGLGATGSVGAGGGTTSGGVGGAAAAGGLGTGGGITGGAGGAAAAGGVGTAGSGTTSGGVGGAAAAGGIGTGGSGITGGAGGAAATGGVGTGGVSTTGGTGGAAAAGGVGTGGTSTTGGSGGNGGSGGGILDAAIDVGPTPVICAGVACSDGQACCYTDGKCFNKTNPAACPKPPEDNDPDNLTTCASELDCAATEYCFQDNMFLCLGNGHCRSQANCTDGGTFFGLCGCDGVTYANYGAACAAGARLSNYNWACGPATPRPDGAPSEQGDVRFCGNDSQCAPGTSCCSITGRCYDPAKPGLCMFPPPGTGLPCIEDKDCFGIATNLYCDGLQCSGPGGCREADGICNGELFPVCSCDGKNYMNEKCAHASGKRVKHSGYCSDAALR